MTSDASLSSWRRARRDRRATGIGAVIVGLIVGLAVLREILAPDSPIVPEAAQLIVGSQQRSFARPLGLLLEILVEMAALNVVARFSDRRQWRPVTFVVAACVVSI